MIADLQPALVRGGPLPPAGKYNQVINAATPAWSQQMEIWLTPWGFLKGAAANNATLKTTKVNGVPYKVLTWIPAQKAPSGATYKVSGYLDADNLVEHTETWFLFDSIQTPQSDREVDRDVLPKVT